VTVKKVDEWTVVIFVVVVVVVVMVVVVIVVEYLGFCSILKTKKSRLVAADDYKKGKLLLSERDALPLSSFS
jgi:maltodextrin utilization protein YvdJ